MERTFVTWGSGSTVYVGLGPDLAGRFCAAQSGELYDTATQGVAAVENLFRKCSANPDPYVEMARDWLTAPSYPGGQLTTLASALRQAANEALERAELAVVDALARRGIARTTEQHAREEGMLEALQVVRALKVEAGK